MPAEVQSPAFTAFERLLEKHTQAELARVMDVRYQLINDVLHGRKRMSAKMLKFLGFERVEVIRRIKP